MKKTISVITLLILAIMLVACGNGDNAVANIKGEQKSWGEISVFVPEGYVLKGGSITGTDDTDKTQCSVQPEKTDMYNYYWISVKDKSSIDDSISTAKDINNAEDITFKTGNIEWTGCNYKYKTALNGEVDCGSVAANIDGIDYLVTYCGHSPNSDEMTAVLGSVTAAK